MKVALVHRRFAGAPSPAGPVERSLAALARGLAAKGHAVHVFANRVDGMIPAGVVLHHVPVLPLGGAAKAELDSLGIDYTGIRFWNALLDRYLGRARSELGAAAAEAAWEEGRRTDLESAIEEALREG